MDNLPGAKAIHDAHYACHATWIIWPEPTVIDLTNEDETAQALEAFMGRKMHALSSWRPLTSTSVSKAPPPPPQDDSTRLGPLEAFQLEEAVRRSEEDELIRVEGTFLEASDDQRLKARRGH